MSHNPNELYLGKAGEMKREIQAPEGVPLRVVVADTGTRAMAFMMDMAILFLIIFSVYISFYLTFGSDSGYLSAVVGLLTFFVWNFYYVFFEVRWRGATPGKRRMGLRVIDKAGGPLTSSAIFARNLVRNVELWIPLGIILNPQSIGADIPGYLAFVASLWAVVLLLMPLFNRDRLRVGDMIAGTLVVLEPKTTLLRDMSRRSTASAAFDAVRPAHGFTRAQLGAYGVYELQVLERLLRSKETIDYEQKIEKVAERIKRKIAWRDTVQDPERWLRDYYAALRAHLERKMLFGRKKKDKYNDTIPP